MSPLLGRTRSIRLGASLVSLVSLAATLAGCGATRSVSGDEAPVVERTAVVVPGCGADDPVVQQAQPLLALDLTGDGGKSNLSWTGAGPGPCGGVVVARVGDVVSGVSLGALTDPSTARAVRPAADGPSYLAIQEQHPRGGFQQHLLGSADGRLVEVSAGDGAPLVPFVATDVEQSLALLDCRDGGVVLVTAKLTEPPGVVLTWDVRTTEYALDAGEATRTDSHTRVTYPDRELRHDLPALFSHRMFGSCTAG